MHGPDALVAARLVEVVAGWVTVAITGILPAHLVSGASKTDASDAGESPTRLAHACPPIAMADQQAP
ncbi:hypothetical protein WME73_14875 [Sorangium sp. So ce302]|uniref:hypothetical protein n=1 Tax=Sorangium sp. So ce302 TaxID=3133297 RepID=UPI003F5EB242